MQMLRKDELEDAIRDGLDLLNNMNDDELVCPLCGNKTLVGSGMTECHCEDEGDE